jgi:hypothetical protein
MPRRSALALSLLGLLVGAPAADAAAPQVTLTSPDAPTTWNTRPRLNIAVHDDDGDITALSGDCRVDGTPVACRLSTSDFDAHSFVVGLRGGPYGPGAHTLSVRVTDGAGNFTDASLNWTTMTDSIAPVLTSFGQLNTQGDVGILGWTIEDDHWSNVEVSCTVDGGVTSARCYAYTDGGELHGLAPGPHTVEVHYDDTQNYPAVATTTVVMPGVVTPTPTPTPVDPTPVTPPVVAPPGTFTAPKTVTARKHKASVKFVCAAKQGCAAASYRLLAGRKVVGKVKVPAGATRTVTAKVSRAKGKLTLKRA